MTPKRRQQMLILLGRIRVYQSEIRGKIAGNSRRQELDRKRYARRRIHALRRRMKERGLSIERASADRKRLGYGA